MTRKISNEEVGIVKTARAFDDMMRTEGWEYFCQLVDDKINQKRQELESMDYQGGDALAHALRTEQVRGAIVALKLVRGLARQTSDMAREILADVTPNDKENDDAS